MFLIKFDENLMQIKTTLRMKKLIHVFKYGFSHVILFKRISCFAWRYKHGFCMRKKCGQFFKIFVIHNFFLFPLFKISTGVSTLGMILGSAFIAFKQQMYPVHAGARKRQTTTNGPSHARRMQWLNTQI